MALEIPDALCARLKGPVAVLGGGVSGSAAVRLLEALGLAAVVYDAKGVAFSASAAKRHPLVVYSPGFRPDHPWLGWARAARADCWGELDFAARFWQGRIVAVTGTNGKTTLTEFLQHALRAAGRTAWAAGNIGRAFCSVVAETDGGTPEAMAICEVSSFQAETLRHLRASATLWTNIAEDHLERHADMAEYFAAKAELARRSDALYAGTSVRAFVQSEKRVAALLAGAGRIAWVDSEGAPPDPRLAGTVFAEYPQHENFLLAAAWWQDYAGDLDSLYEAAANFRLGPHRLTRVGTRAGITYWNDSKATNFHAVEAALRTFPAPVLLIAGGKAKGGDIAAFARRIGPRVRQAFLIGETAGALAEGLASVGVAHIRCKTLREAVRAADAAARPGDHVLLSPAFASFDLFRGYADRGEQFEQLVRELGQPPPLLSL